MSRGLGKKTAEPEALPATEVACTNCGGDVETVTTVEEFGRWLGAHPGWLCARCAARLQGEAPRHRGLGRKTLALRAEVLEVLRGFDGPMSSRQVAYQLVSRGAMENTEKAKAAVLRLLVAMRRDRSVPYARIVDRNRAKYQRAGWDGVPDILEAVTTQYRRNVWTDQAVVPMIACEKAALEGIFSGIVDEYGASLWTLRGFNSESFDYEWSEEVKAITAEGKRVVIVYFGDWDPSGLCIEETSRRKLAAFGAKFTWRRAGLLPGDFKRFGLVRIPVKHTDSRAKAFLSRFADGRAAELDALPPDELARRIRAAVRKHLDAERWEAVQRVEKAEREALDLVAGNWTAAVAGAGGAA